MGGMVGAAKVVTSWSPCREFPSSTSANMSLWGARNIAPVWGAAKRQDPSCKPGNGTEGTKEGGERHYLVLVWHLNEGTKEGGERHYLVLVWQLYEGTKEGGESHYLVLVWHLYEGTKEGERYYSVSRIYLGRVYCGIGYIPVACWTPFFCPPSSRILQMWRPRVRYFSWNRGNSLHSIRGRQFFAKSTRAYLSMRAGTHAVRWAATLGGALTPPLCRRVGSS